MIRSSVQPYNLLPGGGVFACAWKSWGRCWRNGGVQVGVDAVFPQSWAQCLSAKPTINALIGHTRGRTSNPFLSKGILVQYYARTGVLRRTRQHRMDASWMNKSNVHRLMSTAKWTSFPELFQCIQFQGFASSEAEELSEDEEHHSQILFLRRTGCEMLCRSVLSG